MKPLKGSFWWSKLVEKQGDKVRKILWKNKRTKTMKNITNLKQKIELKNHVCGPIKMNIIKLSKRLQVTSYGIFKTSVFWVNQSDKSHQK
jgi:hypothetical protein